LSVYIRRRGRRLQHYLAEEKFVAGGSKIIRKSDNTASRSAAGVTPSEALYRRHAGADGIAIRVIDVLCS
jgi:hypothetical protein